MQNMFFVSGLPRSGSTLLMNILGQHPDVHVTPTSGCHEVLWTTRNNWNMFTEHKADKKSSDSKNLQRVLSSILNSYHDTSKPIIFDKHRSWIHSIELLEFILQKNTKIIVPVRTITDILTSFEQLYRKTSHLQNVPGDFLNSQSTEGRISHWISSNGEVGIAYNRLKDVLHRGYGNRLLLVEFEALTYNPHNTLNKIWEFLEIEPIIHDFNNVLQITHEDDTIHGYSGLHDIRSKVLPVISKSNQILGDQLCNKFKNSEFWR
jgi:sulfotransferase